MQRAGRAVTVVPIVLVLLLLAGHLSSGLRVERILQGDEIWTVDAILARGYDSLLTFVLGQDSHPPLYYLAAKTWTLLGFTTIPKVRLLSYCFALLALLSFCFFHFRYRVVAFVAPTLLLATNPLFTYYAATVRPYALVVFLASLVSLSALVLRQNSSHADGRAGSQLPAGERRIVEIVFYASCLLLGITHYYGTLYVVTLLCLELAERRLSATRLYAVATIGLLLIWPVLQVSFGTLGYQVQSNDWVYVLPLVSTLNNMFMGLFPLQLVSRQPGYIYSLAMLLILICSCWLPMQAQARSFSFKAIIPQVGRGGLNTVAYLFIPLFVSYLFSVIADLKTPFSTPYYFLSCLPATAILFGIFIKRLSRRLPLPLAALLLAAISFSQWLLALERIQRP